jgi:ADP-heptose:LPS heptosyltransferase
MSNILIIKHGSLGDLIQANGAIEDIKNSYKDSKVLLLTSKPYVNFMSSCPYIDGVIEDKRLPRWNFFYLFGLKRLLSRYKFSHVFDLQNSRRTKFYKNFILNKAIWSSTLTSLEPGQKKKNFDKHPVLDRMEIQLQKSGIKTIKIKNVDLSWAIVDVEKIIKQHTSKEYILIFPFCSKKHLNKKWPYFKDLINKIKRLYDNKYNIFIIPGPNEIKDSKNFNVRIILDDGRPVSITQLITLIHKSKFIISNDTGPAHICSHLNKNGLVLFGNHVTPQKVSIESSNFKAVIAENLLDLTSDKVFEEIKKKLN